MHRSGTSATTGALQCLGVQLGRKLYKGHEGINAKGYFEHSDIADTNEEALLAIGSSWDDILLKEGDWWRRPELQLYEKKIRRFIKRDFSHSELWSVKDPRVCRLLPWWLDILSAEAVKPFFLFVVRSPAAVFRSLESRDGFSKEKSYLLWTLHYLEAERWSRGHPRAFLGFDSFLDDPVGEFRHVEKSLGLNFPIPVDKAAASLAGFLSRDLRHHKDGPASTLGKSAILEMAGDLHTQLQIAVNQRTHEPNQSVMDVIWERMSRYQKATFVGPMIEHLRSVGKDRGQQRITLYKLVRSWSWYTGKPIRYLERLLGRDV